jgi:hypothetical protein
MQRATPERLALLRGFVSSLRYKPGWVFKLGGPLNRFVCVFATTLDSGHPTRARTTQHMFEVPDDACDTQTLARWVFSRLLDAEYHEAAEFLTVDGFAPFFPNHQDEGSPYAHVERWET